MIRFNFKKLIIVILSTLIFIKPLFSAETIDPIKVNWSFKELTGKFDRASLQRGFQVYKEVCSSCHSMQYLSYRNLGEPGGPEFTLEEVKAIAASVEIEDGPDSQGLANHQINLRAHILMLRHQRLQMVELTRLICQCLLKHDQEEQIICIQF